MRLLEPSEELRHLLDGYCRLSGVIDHLLVQVGTAEFASDYERHRQAALHGIRVLDDERIEPDRLQGEPITTDRLLGEREPLGVGDDASGPGYQYA